MIFIIYNHRSSSEIKSEFGRVILSRSALQNQGQNQSQGSIQ